MSVEDYKRSNQSSDRSTSIKSASPFGMMLIGAVFGFLGGMMALRLNPEIVNTTTSSITEKVIVEQGEVIKVDTRSAEYVSRVK